MVKLLIFTLLALAIGCNQPVNVTPLQEHVASFYEAAARHHARIVPNKIVIRFTSRLPDTAVGVCYMKPEGIRLILILKPFYEKSSYLGQQELVWHELGHCALDRYHSQRKLPDGHLASIMYPIVFSDEDLQYYQAHRDYYESELFN